MTLSAETPAISVDKLRKIYGAVTAVDGISFSVARGSITGLLGGNGAGKTTTIGMVLGLVLPTGGKVSVLGHDPAAGYRGIIAIHSTILGPALGGTRFWSYASDDEAIVDALRLARGMTYKNAVAGLNLGGGKSVIIGDNKTKSRELLFRAHGRFVESLGGRYITAEDVGTSTADMDWNTSLMGTPRVRAFSRSRSTLTCG